MGANDACQRIAVCNAKPCKAKLRRLHDKLFGMGCAA